MATLRKKSGEHESPPRIEATHQHMTCRSGEVENQLVCGKDEKGTAYLGIQEVLALASDLPDGQVRLIPVLANPVDEGANLDPCVVADYVHNRNGQIRSSLLTRRHERGLDSFCAR